MDLAGVLHEGDGAVTNIFAAGWCGALAVVAAFIGDVWLTLIFGSVGAANIWVGVSTLKRIRR